MAQAKGVHSKKETMKPKTNIRPTSAVRSIKSASALRNHCEVLTKENTELTASLARKEEENTLLKEKLRSLSYEIIESSNKSGKQYEFDPNTDVLDIPLNDLKSLIVVLSTSQSKPKSTVFETRIEEVETRITLLSGELAKLVKLKLKIQNGLQSISDSVNLEDAKKLARQMWVESSATEVFVNPVSEKDNETETSDVFSTEKSNLESRKSPITVKSRSSRFPHALAVNLQQVEILPVSCKLPGNTHIKEMSESLTKLIVQELSLYKGNGADWRMLAERVGVPDHMIKQWEVMKLAQPMKNVLVVWGESSGATVRMLHRHLISPQMKKILLAKRISDHYIVD